jgi:hypothetical protein
VLCAQGASTKINGVSYDSKGSAAAPQNLKDLLPPAQALRLKKVFLFPSMDDLSGALAPKLDEKLVSLFSRNTRFELIRDPQVVKALSPDEASYYKAAQNQAVHKEAAKVTGADTTVLLRTRNLGPNTQMNFELRDANGNLLFMEEGSVPGSAPMETRWGLVEKLYKGMLDRLPFEGTVTGRTANTLTVDLGLGSMRQGEEVEIARIVSVQRHPLLGTIVGTDYVRTGRAKVTTVDRVLSFAEVEEEFAGEKISPGQKVLRAQATVVRRPAPAVGPEEEGEKRPKARPGKQPEAQEADPADDRLTGEFDRPKARFGQLGGNLYYGSLGHSQNVNSAQSEYTGSGLGGGVDGELWITKNWILLGSFGMHGATMGGQGATVGSESWREFSLVGGFRIFPESLADGVILTAGLGYQSMDFDIPANAGLSLGGKKYTGPVVRADGEIFFLEKQKITLGFGIQPFSTISEAGPTLGVVHNGTVIGLHLGWNRQLANEIWFKVGMRYDVANGSYENSTSSITNKRFAIGPGIYYLF